MSNKLRGQVQIEALGRTFTLRLSVNDLIELQDALGITDDAEFLATLPAQMTGLRSIRKFVQFGLRGEPGVDEKMAGDIMTELGVEGMVPAVMQALEWAFPKATKRVGPEGKAPLTMPPAPSPGPPS